MDVMIGTALVLIVFLGIFGAYQLGMKVIDLSRNKIAAISIANQHLELIRNLPYSSVGTKGAVLPYAEGILEKATTTTLNNVEYNVTTTVKYISDEADGTGAGDDCDLDYKKAQVRVGWSRPFPGEIKLVTDVAPKDIFEELASCEEQPGGILSVQVFDAQGVMVSSPTINVYDPETGTLIDSVTPSSGEYDFLLATSTYKVEVLKDGYSTERTYGIDEIATPEKPHPLVLEGEITEISFSIDKVSTFSVDTLSPWGRDYFADSFEDTSKISEVADLAVAEGEAKLATTSEGYVSSGYLFSQVVKPQNLVNWDELSWSDSEFPETDLKYQIYFASGTDWLMVPESDLAGNQQGFDITPVDLSGLDVNKYFMLKIRGNFSTNSTSFTPVLYGWELSWITSEATSIGNVDFDLRGEKIIGKDENENPVYKYFQVHASDGSGHIDITGLEWDDYTFSAYPEPDLNLVGTDPSPQPISLAPDATQPVDLYLEAQNSLLLTVQDLETLEPIFSASTTLSKVGFSETQFTDEDGQIYFIPLEEANYDLSISAAGYLATSTSVWVSGDVTEAVKLRRIE